MLKHTLVSIFLLLALVMQARCDTPCSNALASRFVDSDYWSDAVARARTEFMRTRPHPFSRCDITVLVPREDGTILRASHNQNGLGYPASTVKLTYLASAIAWCKQKGFKFSCIDAHLRPMIQTSDNFETGVVVDLITESHNIEVGALGQKDPKYEAFLKQRNFTQTLFESRGLLEDQVILSKTYPTNSGSVPSGAEAMIRKQFGQNAMKPKCAASLMAEIAWSDVYNFFERNYLLGMLQHARYAYSSIGMGTPPGSVLYNKVGNAYDTLEEIAYIKLPNGYDMVLAVYTNGYEPSEPEINNLSYLAELIIDYLGIYRVLGYKVILDTRDAVVSGPGWTKKTDKPDKFGNDYFENSGSFATKEGIQAIAPNATWQEQVPNNIFEVSVWTPEDPHFGDVTYTVRHASGTDAFKVSQQVNGGRWTKLGDFNFEISQNALITVSAASNRPFFANAVKLTQWPSCRLVPGTSCASLPFL
jgi:protein phosphatase methylesterase 1